MGRWGYGLFQSELELDAVGDLDIDCGLGKLRSETEDEHDSGEETEDENASLSEYTLYCPTDAELVREHIETPDAATAISPLDSALTKWKAKALGNEFYFPSSGQMFILLGACAMSLGCKLSAETLQDLRNVFTKCGLFPDALVQMDAALNGPGRYQGRPWKFVSPDSFEDVHDPEEISRANKCLITKIEARMEAYALEKDDHGICGAPGCQATQSEAGGDLLMCSRCEERKYCSKDCQTKHWKSHKRVCVKAT